MYKIIIRIILVLIIFIFFSVIYLSYFGIKTNRFNSLIQSKIKFDNLVEDMVESDLRKIQKNEK